ncbi:MAG: phosphoribosylaminoimidazolesuccinocarboxamide synthase, partial [Xanthomonadaceae bacterium]|nr:phosphoribosylaminoimidazolesuccinocarboxamide synthase [Xanthomonadaceae bacterium]
MSATAPSPPLFESNLRGLALLHRGKVRDIYEVDDRHMLIVTTDRLSAFDVVLPDPIPGKGRILTKISQFWFDKTRHIVPNHTTDYPLERAVADENDRSAIADRSMIVKRLRALPIEAVVRGYLIGSGWRDYQQTGMVCGITLPHGLRQAEKLPEPLFTPATKAQLGEHDENIAYDRVVELVGRGVAEQVRATALALYTFAAEHALARGIIIADTKFEFGLDEA